MTVGESRNSRLVISPHVLHCRILYIIYHYKSCLLFLYTDVLFSRVYYSQIMINQVSQVHHFKQIYGDILYMIYFSYINHLINLIDCFYSRRFPTKKCTAAHLVQGEYLETLPQLANRRREVGHFSELMYFQQCQALILYSIVYIAILTSHQVSHFSLSSSSSSSSSSSTVVFDDFSCKLQYPCFSSLSWIAPIPSVCAISTRTDETDQSLTAARRTP